MKKQAVLIGYETVLWIVRLVFLVIVMVSFIFVVTIKIETEVMVRDTQLYVVLESLLYAPEGLAHDKQDTQQVAGIVLDEKKFAKRNLIGFSQGNPATAGCLSLGKPCFNACPANCVLIDERCQQEVRDAIGISSFTSAGCESKREQHERAVIYNKELFDRISPLAEAGFSVGRGGVSKINGTKSVRVRNGDETRTEVLYYEILAQNS